jgi:acetyl esterase/lipase
LVEPAKLELTFPVPGRVLNPGAQTCLFFDEASAGRAPSLWLSVINYLNPDFPPCFISVGNGDPLQEHSKALASKVATLHVKMDTLFYPSNYLPDLPHEYRFNLDIDAGNRYWRSLLTF